MEPQEGFARLIFKLRQEGPAWILRRLQSELTLPTTKPGKIMHAALRRTIAVGSAPVRSARRLIGTAAPVAKDTLYAFYDLKVEPITFDILWFLAGADLQRRRLGLEHVHVVIVPGSDDGLRKENPSYEAVVDRDARRWRIHNILISAVGLLPSCIGFALAGSRHEAAVIRSRAAVRYYPKGYEPILPVAHHPNDSLFPARAGTRPIGVLRAGAQALRYIDQWVATHVAGRRMVTITLRDYEYNPGRNSNVVAWAEFARGLDLKLWFPVFVLDTERTFQEVPKPIREFAVFREVSWNVGLRMALYERAWLNLGVNNGPMALCWLNERTRYITFKIVTPGVGGATVAFNRSRGFEPHQSLPFATPLQSWVWEDDSLDVIEREFQQMVARVENASLSRVREKRNGDDAKEHATSDRGGN